ncbi:MAG: phosphoribosylformylglycinamidine synthase subunit PurQ [Deltaproteobacteria bacterium]|nr:phosphoribosylformylglycinamidine synthase subunit PurQ [Deltaproteobacteria bacterium]
MSAPVIRALVLAGYGLNCDVETAHVLRLAGAEAERVHISDLTGAPDYPATRTLEGFHILVFDGGFAWGDDHGAGVLLANRLLHQVGPQLEGFLARGGVVLGICNGFQALVNLGLLPGLTPGFQREVALMANDCGNFQDRWVELLPEDGSRCRFTQGLGRLELPMRHGEGKLFAAPAVLAALERDGLVALRYGDGRGRPAGGKWPANPNGSLHDIAGICDPSGRVLGLMPHPEGHYRHSQHPNWTAARERARRAGQAFDPAGAAAGLTIFTNAVAAAREAL